MKQVPGRVWLWIFGLVSLVCLIGCSVDLKEGYRRFQENHPFYGPEEYRYEEPIPQGEPPVTEDED